MEEEEDVVMVIKGNFDDVVIVFKGFIVVIGKQIGECLLNKFIVDWLFLQQLFVVSFIFCDDDEMLRFNLRLL